MRGVRVIYAGMLGNGSGGEYRGLGPLSGVLILLSIATAAFGGSRRRVTIALIILMIAAVSQVGCDSGSVPS